MVEDKKFKPQKDINRLKTQLKKLEKEKDRIFPGLGQATYQAFREGRLKDPALEETCRKLKELDAGIEQVNSQVEQLKAQVEQMKVPGPPQAGLCAFCGTPLDPGTKFCGNCGQVLAPQAPRAAAACLSCGSAVAPGVKFCAECGRPVAASPPAAAGPATPPPPPPVAPQQPPSPPAGAVAVAQAGKKCAGCGALAEEDDAAFCGECGANL